jgi:hypothetical protein
MSFGVVVEKEESRRSELRTLVGVYLVISDDPLAGCGRESFAWKETTLSG